MKNAADKPVSINISFSVNQRSIVKQAQLSPPKFKYYIFHSDSLNERNLSQIKIKSFVSIKVLKPIASITLLENNEKLKVVPTIRVNQLKMELNHHILDSAITILVEKSTKTKSTSTKSQKVINVKRNSSQWIYNNEIWSMKASLQKTKRVLNCTVKVSIQSNGTNVTKTILIINNSINTQTHKICVKSPGGIVSIQRLSVFIVIHTSRVSSILWCWPRARPRPTV